MKMGTQDIILREERLSEVEVANEANFPQTQYFTEQKGNLENIIIRNGLSLTENQKNYFM